MLVVPTAERTANVNPCTLSLVFATTELKRNVLLWRVRIYFRVSLDIVDYVRQTGAFWCKKRRQGASRFSVINRLAYFHAISYFYEQNQRNGTYVGICFVR